ncbi:MAG: arsenite efflux transporter metallochaperone ArsD [Syntrophobacteraceae bacterium]|nr:arsenite efflux transporter metallochaperone ArsD [Syntrophobacteraceae bacterium]
MPKLEVFDPAMCCSTGVCGPVVDPTLPRFAADLDWLKGRGVNVERFNLAQQPAMFASNDIVKNALSESGTDCLPLLLVDGRIVSQGSYPCRERLAEFCGVESEGPASIFSPAVAELVAIGASIACNCTPCFDYHYRKARELGLSNEDIALAVRSALGVEKASSRAVIEVAERNLGPLVILDSRSHPEEPGSSHQRAEMVFPMVGSGSHGRPSSECC